MAHLPRVIKVAALGAVCFFLADVDRCFATGAAPAPTELSGVDRRYFDPATRIQDDLSRAVNGKWLDTAKIPVDQSSWRVLDQLRELTRQQLHTALEDLVRANVRAPYEKRLADFYSSYMDDAAVERRGLAPYAAELAQINAVKTLSDVYREFGHLQLLNVATPLEFHVSPDNGDTTQQVFTLSQGGLGLPNRDFYLDRQNKDFAALRAGYTALMADMLILAGDPNASKLAPQLLAFETSLAEISWSNAARRDPLATYNKVALGGLPILSPRIDWSAFGNAIGYYWRVSSIVVSEPSYVAALGDLITETPIAVLKAYLKFQLLDAFADDMPQAFAERAFSFNSRMVRGTTQPPARWKRAIELIDASIGDDLGQLYCTRYFSVKNKAAVETIVNNVLAAFATRIDTLDWMSDATKKEARLKLEKMSVKIGYPDHPKDYSAVEIKPDDLGGNALRAAYAANQRELYKLGHLVDRREWILTAQTVDAGYDPSRNDITFPAAILQPPYFNALADRAVNYGGIGSVIGHEISHAFDDQGAHFDGDGNLRNWWTEADYTAFAKKIAALVAQYERFSPLPGYHINGSQTLGENVADNSGLAVAFRAFHLSLSDEASPMIDGMTGDQRFYYGFGQLWRSKERDAATIVRLKSNSHPPDYYRGNGSVRNQPGFYEAFDLKSGDLEYLPPEQRVLIW